MSQSYDKHDQKVIRVLRKVGYIAAHKIAESLQGIMDILLLIIIPKYS